MDIQEYLKKQTHKTILVDARTTRPKDTKQMQVQDVVYEDETLAPQDWANVDYFIGSSETVDRDGDVLVRDGAVVDGFKQHAPFLFMHDGMGLPIGRVVYLAKVRRKKTRAWAIGVLYAEDIPEYDLPRIVKGLYRGGFMKAVSVGFDWIDGKYEPIYSDVEGENRMTGIRHNAWEMLEFSAVNIPANPDALHMATQKGYLGKGDAERITSGDIVAKSKAAYEKARKEKRVVPFQDFPCAEDMDLKWSGKVARDQLAAWAEDEDGNIDFEKYGSGFLWYDIDNPEVRASYKMPVVYIMDGEPHYIWQGVVAAAAVLNGARGGPDIPAGDIPKVYEAVKKIYTKFDQEAPELVESAEPEEDKDDDKAHEPDGGKVGAVLNKNNKALLAEAVDNIQRVIASAEREEQAEDEAEPEQDDDKAVEAFDIKTAFETYDKKLRELQESLDKLVGYHKARADAEAADRERVAAALLGKQQATPKQTESKAKAKTVDTRDLYQWLKTLHK